MQRCCTVLQKRQPPPRIVQLADATPIADPSLRPTRPRLLAADSLDWTGPLYPRRRVSRPVAYRPRGSRLNSVRSMARLLVTPPASELTVFTSLSLSHTYLDPAVSTWHVKHPPATAPSALKPALPGHLSQLPLLTQHPPSLAHTSTGPLHSDPLCNQATSRHHAPCQRYFGPGNDIALQPCPSTGPVRSWLLFISTRIHRCPRPCATSYFHSCRSTLMITLSIIGIIFGRRLA